MSFWHGQIQLQSAVITTAAKPSKKGLVHVLHWKRKWETGWVVWNVGTSIGCYVLECHDDILIWKSYDNLMQGWAVVYCWGRYFWWCCGRENNLLVSKYFIGTAIKWEYMMTYTSGSKIISSYQWMSEFVRSKKRGSNMTFFLKNRSCKSRESKWFEHVLSSNFVPSYFFLSWIILGHSWLICFSPCSVATTCLLMFHSLEFLTFWESYLARFFREFFFAWWIHVMPLIHHF